MQNKKRINYPDSDLQIGGMKKRKGVKSVIVNLPADTSLTPFTVQHLNALFEMYSPAEIRQTVSELYRYYADHHRGEVNESM